MYCVISAVCRVAHVKNTEMMFKVTPVPVDLPCGVKAIMNGKTSHCSPTSTSGHRPAEHYFSVKANPEGNLFIRCVSD